MMNLRERRGMGALVVLVLVVIAILGTLGIASSFQGSGTARSHHRMVDVRAALEAAESAIHEAVAYVRQSVDQGKALPPHCPDDWKSLLADAWQAGSPPSSRTIHPVLARLELQTDDTPLTIGDVTVTVPAQFAPARDGSGVRKPPQAVLQMSVKVRYTEGLIQVERTVTQRRLIYAAALTTASMIDSRTVQFYIAGYPMGTVIE